MNKALNYLGIARKSGAIETGEDNASACVKAGKARALIVASDTSDAARRRAEGYVYETGTVLLEVPFTKQEIADICGKTGCSMAALTDMGLAAAFAKALCEENESFVPQYESLKTAQERISKRRAEKPGRGSKMGNRRKSV